MKNALHILLLGAAALLITVDTLGAEVYTGSEMPADVMMANIPNAGRYLGRIDDDGACVTGFFLVEGALVKSYLFCPIKNNTTQMWILMNDHEGKQRLVLN